MKKKSIITILCIIVAILATYVIWKNFGKDNAADLKVACNLTITGDFGLYGESIQKGILMAQEDLHDSAIANDVNVVYDFIDNASDTKNAVTICKRQEMTGFDIYMSGITPQSAAIIPLLEKTGKPHFIWGFAPVLFSKEDNLFRTWVDYPREAECFLNYLNKNPQFIRVACLYPNVESAQTLFNKLFVPKLPSSVSLVFNEAYDVSVTNFKDIVLKMKKEAPDVIFINGMDMHIPNIIKDMAASGMKKEGNMVFTFDLMDAVPKTSPELMEGLIANIPKAEISPSPKRIEWEKRFKEKYGVAPNYTNAYAYDLGIILYHVALNSKTRKGMSFSDLLLETDIEGVTGRLRFSPEGLLIGEYVTSIYKNSEFVPINY